jgi:hypothetical protein
MHIQSKRTSDAEDGADPELALDPGDHPHYAFVLKMVLWGEDRDEVFHRLAVNGVPDRVAERLYEHARADRLRTLRRDSARKLIGGLALVIGAVAIFSSCWFGLGFIPQILLYGCFGAAGYGLWKAIDGLAGVLMASSKTGSIAEDF